MTDNHQPNSDPLDVAVRAVHAEPALPGPADDLFAATVAATLHTERRRRIMRVIKIGSISTGLAAAIALAAVLWPGRTAADEVKAAVRKAEQAKTVRLRVELDAAGQKVSARMYQDQGKSRSEMDPAGLVVVINKDAANKGVMLVRPAKMYRVLDVEKDPLVKQTVANMTKAFDQFKLPADDQVATLPAEYLDGRKTRVYEIKGVKVDGGEFQATADLKMWIDAKTGMPAQSRVVSRVAGKTYTAVATYLGFDEELDPALFDTSVPAGWTPMPAAPAKKD